MTPNKGNFKKGTGDGDGSPLAAEQAPLARRSRLGPGSVNLRILSEALGFKVGQRGSEVFLPDTDPRLLALGRKALRGLEIMPTAEESPSAWEVECLGFLISENPDIDLDEFFSQPAPSVAGKATVARTEAQKSYLAAMRANDLVFGLGPAGTGKTYLAVATAVSELLSGNYGKLVLTRPAVEAGERLGFLPGDLAEKIDPYLRPLWDALQELMPQDKFQRFAERRQIEVAPLAFMRGRTLSNAFVILDEAQNTSREQMKMFLTRLGPGSKAVVTGDPGQSDLPLGEPSGLKEAMEILPGINGISFCFFSSRDTVRHRLVRQILEAYQSPRRGR
ncbi:MAG: PhoH family protein [Deltaproteobacteria bacterium]|jgi:phosphate starvation-inducible PhoH-like protein|nr:PhoH family protein [Deltaproteobacteria bacterium]